MEHVKSVANHPISGEISEDGNVLREILEDSFTVSILKELSEGF